MDRPMREKKRCKVPKGQSESRVKSSLVGFYSLCRKSLLSREKRSEVKQNRAQRRQADPMAAKSRI